ncbi:hypothetical protein NL425_27455, partial [Klebsiella pneumoniae]|nr:hypothetical protein [Klebsiella pneumoniae]
IADAAITSGLDWLLREARAAGRLAPGDPDAPGQGCGLAVIAMGKHGARELNYSSDIDLIVVYDRDVAPLAAGVDASPFFV